MMTFAIFVGAGLFLLASFVLPCRIRLALAVPLSVFQLYLPGIMIGGYPPPMALLGALLLWPEFFIGLAFMLAWRPTQLIFSIGIAYVFSLVWSIDLQLGIRSLVYLWIFLAIFSAAVLEGRRNPSVIVNLLTWTVVLAALQVVTIVVFRLMPIIKVGYLQSPIARLFINKNVLDVLFTTMRNNVTDPLKSGGMLFTNANVAGAYMAVIAFTGIGLALVRKSTRLFVASILYMVAIFFTGSKAAIVLALLGSLMVLFLIAKNEPRLRRRLQRWMFVIAALSVLSGCWWLVGSNSIGSSSATAKTFAEESDATLAIRQQIWSYAATAFSEHPLLGQGFGGWQKGFAVYARFMGMPEGFPPHDTIIYLWSQGGLVAAMSGILFMLCLMIFARRQLGVHAGQPGFGLVLAPALAFAWVFTHGLGENFGLLGDEHMTPILAALLALAYIQRNPGASKNLILSRGKL